MVITYEMKTSRSLLRTSDSYFAIIAVMNFALLVVLYLMNCKYALVSESSELRMVPVTLSNHSQSMPHDTANSHEIIWTFGNCSKQILAASGSANLCTGKT
jgi:hypothetical protein